MTENSLGLAWIALALTLAFLGIWLWIWAQRKRASLGLPRGKVVYRDNGAWQELQQPLYSAEIGLTGKPDYLVQDDTGGIIPVELKSRPAPQEPHRGHVLQLAAYCLLVDEVFGVKPDYGIIQYSDRAFAVDYTLALESELLDLIAIMREDLFEEELHRSHDDYHRCSHCGFKNHCEERLLPQQAEFR